MFKHSQMQKAHHKQKFTSKCTPSMGQYATSKNMILKPHVLITAPIINTLKTHQFKQYSKERFHLISLLLPIRRVLDKSKK